MTQSTTSENAFDDAAAAGRARMLLGRTSVSMPQNRVKPTAKSSGMTTRGSSSAAINVAPPGAAEQLSVKARLHQRLLDEINERDLLGCSEEDLGAAVRDFVDRVLNNEKLPLNEGERRRLADDLIEETLGVGPLAPLMADPAVTDILVNRFDQVYVERHGRLERTDVRFRDSEHLTPQRAESAPMAPGAGLMANHYSFGVVEAFDFLQGRGAAWLVARSGLA